MARHTASWLCPGPDQGVGDFVQQGIENFSLGGIARQMPRQGDGPAAVPAAAGATRGVVKNKTPVLQAVALEHLSSLLFDSLQPRDIVRRGWLRRSFRCLARQQRIANAVFVAVVAHHQRPFGIEPRNTAGDGFLAEPETHPVADLKLQGGNRGDRKLNRRRLHHGCPGRRHQLFVVKPVNAAVVAEDIHLPPIGTRHGAGKFAALMHEADGLPELEGRSAWLGH